MGFTFVPTSKFNLEVLTSSTTSSYLLLVMKEMNLTQFLLALITDDCDNTNVVGPYKGRLLFHQYNMIGYLVLHF